LSSYSGILDNLSCRTPGSLRKFQLNESSHALLNTKQQFRSNIIRYSAVLSRREIILYLSKTLDTYTSIFSGFPSRPFPQVIHTQPSKFINTDLNFSQHLSYPNTATRISSCTTRNWTIAPRNHRSFNFPAIILSSRKYRLMIHI